MNFKKGRFIFAILLLFGFVLFNSSQSSSAAGCGLDKANRVIIANNTNNDLKVTVSGPTEISVEVEHNTVVNVEFKKQGNYTWKAYNLKTNELIMSGIIEISKEKYKKITIDK